MQFRRYFPILQAAQYQIAINLNYKSPDSSIKQSFVKKKMMIEKDREEQQSYLGLRHPSFAKNDHGFDQANWQAATKAKYRQINRYHDNEEVAYSVDLEFFQQYGPGTYLFFQFTRRLSIVFCIMTVLCIPAIVSNYLGGALSKSSAGSTKTMFMQFSISNQPTTTTAEKTTLHNYLIVIPDLVYSLVFFIFLLHWSTASEKLAKKICDNAQLPSYFTVEVSGHRNIHTLPKIQEFMENFGEVHEVAEVKNYDESINLSKQIHQCTMDLKQEQLDDKVDEVAVEKLEVKLYGLYRKLARQVTKTKTNIIKFFVTYKNITDRKNVIEKFKVYDRACLCGKKVEDDVLLDDVIPKVKPCFIQPGSIIWENIHISNCSRYVRWFIQLILLIAAVFVGFLIISFLNILTPTSTTLVDASGETYATVIAKNDASITKAWCLLQSPTEVISNSSLLSMCQTYLIAYYAQITISVVISLSIIVIKSVLKIFITFLSKFQRYESFNQQVSSLIVNLFLTYTFTTFIITFLLQARILDISFKFVITRFISDPTLLSNVNMLVEYEDLSRAWYLDIGYKITMNWITFAIIPHIFQPIILVISECIANWRAKKEKFQRNMDMLIEASVFQFEDNYANILMIVFVTMMLCGPIPILLVLGTVALGTRYLFWKYYFIRFCKIPPTFDESLNDKIMKIMPWSVFIHLAISIYAYGNQQIFPLMPNTLTFVDNIASQLSTGASSFAILLLKRIACSWLLSALLLLVVVAYILKTYFIDSIRALVSACKGDHVQLPSTVIKNNQEFTPAGDKDFINSYKLENNRDYDAIIGILKSFSKKA